MNSIPNFAKSIILNYHLQNTYDTKDSDFLLLEYDQTNDLIEKARFLEAITFTRLPWFLNK
jgi:hypothetical protein